MLFLSALRRRGTGFCERLLEVCNDVVDMFRSHTDANEVFRDA